MNKTTTVAFLILISSTISASPIMPEINRIESQWAKIYYSKTSKEQKNNYPTLLKATLSLSKEHPNSTELMIWQAIVLASNAAFENPISALDSISKAKHLLEASLKKDPQSLKGAAFVVLGTLYYMTPGWPLSFGNQQEAEKLLLMGLKINPSSIDANYFYADYLLSIDRKPEATKYFQLALTCPSRDTQLFADSQLKKEAYAALQKTKHSIVNSGKSRFLSIFSSAKVN